MQTDKTKAKPALTSIQPWDELPTWRKSGPSESVEAVLHKPGVFEKIAPHLTNGGVCGHKVMDLHAVVIVVREAAEGTALDSFGLNDKKLGDVIKNVLRRKYELNKKWKITGLNPKIIALLGKSE